MAGASFQPDCSASDAFPKRVLIVGGGYIGLEAASVARKCGVETTLIEAAPRVLQRVAAQETAERFVKVLSR